MSVWSCCRIDCQASAQSCVRSQRRMHMKPLAAMLASFLLSPPFSLCLSLSLSVSHFNAELIQCGWAGQDQPSGSALLHARQEVARTAACNSTWDFVWVTYIMARLTSTLKLQCHFFVSPFSRSAGFQWWTETHSLKPYQCPAKEKQIN